MINLGKHKYDNTKVSINDIKVEADYKSKVRYKLTIPMQNAGVELLTVIMLNPSYANRTESDRTVNRIIKHGYFNNYAEIEVFNISPFYETSSDKVEEVAKRNVLSKKINKINSNYIEEAIKNNPSHLLLATGNVKGPFMRASYHSVLGVLLDKHFMVFDITKVGYAWHPRNLRNTIIEDKPRMATLEGTKIIFE